MSADFTKQPVDVLHTVNLITQCLCIPIITLFVALRFSARIWFRQYLGVEDTSCLLAWALFMAYCGVAILVGKHGGGYHYWDVSDSDMVLFRKFCYFATITYCPMALLVKIALLSILIRIFSPYKSKILFIYILLGCLCCYYIIAEVIKMRMCNPIKSYWLGSAVKGATCFDQQAALIADSVISVVTDIMILVLPLPLTWSLQMSRNKKLKVIGILSAGGLATAFSVYRLVLVLQDGNSADMTIVFMCVILSGNAEGGLALICACLPTLSILIGKLRNKGDSTGKYYTPDSSIKVSKVKGLNTMMLSSLNREGDTEGQEFGSDQSHLISYAGAVNMGSRDGGEGIHKTVDMSQKVEVLNPK